MSCNKCNDGWIFYKEDGYEYAKKCDCLIKKELETKLIKLNPEYIKENYTFNLDYQKQMYDKAIEFCNQDKIKNIYLSGQPGCGKTFVSVLIIRELIELKKIKKFKMIHFKKLSRILKSNTNEKNFYDLFNEYSKVELLLIDDFMTFKINEADISHIHEFIDNRMRRNLKTIFTSERYMNNYPKEAQNIVSRIWEMCGVGKKGFVIEIGYKEERDMRANKF